MKKLFFTITVSIFLLICSSKIQAQDNPMGKTWVVFIENSSYITLPSLDGPIKDAITIKKSLVNYQINNIIHKKNMTKAEMENFFLIELRNLLQTNQVKSLIIWYAGHGEFVNNVGYWIPSDAELSDEFTYFNMNSLRTGMQSYTSLKHTLVINDASKAGPSFYSARRSSIIKRTCDDVDENTSMSAQIFSSSGYEDAADNSQFAEAFANALTNNKNVCIPIEEIVSSVKIAVTSSNQQKPIFGKIAGLRDENGTFFFIAK